MSFLIEGARRMFGRQRSPEGQDPLPDLSRLSTDKLVDEEIVGQPNTARKANAVNELISRSRQNRGAPARKPTS